MDPTPTFQFEPTIRALHIGFAPGGGAFGSVDAVRAFTLAVESRCTLLKRKVHLFFDLTNLEIKADQVEAFTAAKRALTDRFGLSTLALRRASGRAGDDPQRLRAPGPQALPVPRPGGCGRRLPPRGRARRSRNLGGCRLQTDFRPQTSDSRSNTVPSFAWSLEPAV